MSCDALTHVDVGQNQRLQEFFLSMNITETEKMHKKINHVSG